jgi:PAS domain S-box-containing protein
MENDNYFYKIFEDSPIPTTILCGKFPDIFIKEANAAYIALTGCSRADIIGIPFFITTPPPVIYLDKKGFTDVERSIEKVCLEKIAVKTPVQKFLKSIPDSSEFETLFLEAANTPVFAADGEIDFIIRTLQDVTDIVLATEKEKEKNRKLNGNERLLTETQKVAKIGSWEMDKNERFNWSDIHYEIMEVEPGTEITTEFGVALLKEKKDRELFEKVYKNAIKHGEYFDIELNVVTPKGNERWIRLTGKGELNGGELVRMFGIGQDITEQKKTQQDLVDSRNQLETLIQTVDGAVFESDAQTLEFNFVSEQIIDLLGYTPEDCVHQPNFLNKLLAPNKKEEILKVTFERIKEHKNYTGDYPLIRKDGALVWMKISVSVIYENGSAKWLRGLMMDITASKHISELEHIEKKVLELNVNPSETTINVLKTYLLGIESIFPEMRCAIMQVKHGHLYNWVANLLPPAYEAAINHLPIGDNTGSCGTAAFIGEKVIVSDIATDPRWTNYKEVALQNNLRSCWSQPLKNAAGEVIATLAMYYHTTKSPTEEELKVVDRTVHLLQVILQDRHNVELLEETNFLMEQSQDLAHFGSLEYDVETRKSTWSNELYNIFGIDKSIKPNVDLYYDLLHPDDRARVKSITEDFLKTKEDYVSEHLIIRPSGGIRNLKTWGRIKRNEKGEAVKVIAAYLDITESKKIQEDLLASESRLRSLVDSQTNYVIRIDFNGNYSYANKKYIEDFSPITGQSLIGTNAMELTLRDQRQRIEEVSKKCINQPHEVFEVELEKYSNDGRIRYTFWHFVCLTNSKGEPGEIQCIGIDISDRKKAENDREKKAIELQESEKRYSDLFHLSPQAMWVYDPDSLQFLNVNKAAVEQYGYSQDEFLSMTIKDIRTADKLPELEQAIKSREKHKDFFQGVFTHKKKNGELIQVDIKRNRIPFKDKLAHLILANNITERIEYLEALEKQNERLAEIAWIQSHVVRAPLTRIMGIIDVLENYDNDQIDQSLLFKNIISSAYELDDVIKDIVLKAEQIKLTSKTIRNDR